MNTHIVGFVPPDDKWKQMRAVWDACEEAGIKAPNEVIDFFEGAEPDEQGATVQLDHHDAVSEYNAEMKSGYEVDLQKLPANVRYLRFYNSY